MARYHPPQMITNNAAPVLAADLAYENHGKCGNTRVLNVTEGGNEFNSANEGTSNAWKVVFLHDSTIEEFHANNMSDGNPVIIQNDCSKLETTMPAGTEIMADIDKLTLYVDPSRPSGLCILYLDCEQS